MGSAGSRGTVAFRPPSFPFLEGFVFIQFILPDKLPLFFNPFHPLPHCSLLRTRWNEQPVERRATGLEQGPAHVGIQPAMVLFKSGPPVGQGRLLAALRTVAGRRAGGLAVVAKEFDQFVDDFGFVFLAGPRVTIPLSGRHFGACDLTYFGVHGLVTPFVSQGMVSLKPFPPSVIILSSQFRDYLLGKEAY